MTATTLNKSIIIAAPPEKVWAYLTQPELITKWFHPPKSPLQQGEKLELFGADSGNLIIWGDVRIARPPEYLEYTFIIPPMGDTITVVKWTLDPVEGGTRLSLEHEGLPDTASFFDLLVSLDSGWDEHMGLLRSDLNP